MTEFPSRPPLPLSALNALTESELTRRRDEAWGLVRACRADVSPGNVLALLNHATDHRAVNPSGIVYHPAGLDYRVRVEAISAGPDPSLVVSLVGGGGGEAIGVEWSDDRTASELVADLDEQLDYESDSPQLRLDAVALFDGLIATAQVGFEARLGGVPPDLARPTPTPVPSDVWPIIEVVNRQWAVTVAGVESIERSWRIPIDQLEDLATVEQAAAQSWVRVPEMEAACEEAVLVLPWFDLRA